MSRPLFSVGEDVWVIPCDDTERIPTAVTYRRYTKDSVPAGGGKPYTGWIYKIPECAKNQFVCEYQLRKRHKPSDDTFDEIIESINQGERVAV